MLRLMLMELALIKISQLHTTLRETVSLDSGKYMNQLILDKLSFTVLPPVAFQMDSLQITVSELALHPSQLALNVQYHRGLFLGQAGVAIVQPIAWNVMETSHYVYPARMGITSM